MHRLPDGPSLDEFSRETLDNRGRRELGIRSDYARRNPMRRVTPLRFGHETEPFYSGKRFIISVIDRTSRLHTLVQDLKLPAADAGEDIAHAIIKTNSAVLIVRRRIPRLGCEESCS